MQSEASKQIRSVGRYIFVGILTVAPLWITWLILDFLLTQLARIGRPWVQGLAVALAPRHPQVAEWLLDDVLQSIVAAAVLLAFLFAVGWATTIVVGRRLIAMFEALISFIPFVDTIYRSTRDF